MFFQFVGTKTILNKMFSFDIVLVYINIGIEFEGCGL